MEKTFEIIQDFAKHYNLHDPILLERSQRSIDRFNYYQARLYETVLYYEFSQRKKKETLQKKPFEETPKRKSFLEFFKRKPPKEPSQKKDDLIPLSEYPNIEPLSNPYELERRENLQEDYSMDYNPYSFPSSNPYENL